MQRRKQSDLPRHGPHPDQTRKKIAINLIPITLRCSAPSELRQERCQNAGVMPAVAVTYRAMPAGRQSRGSFSLSMIVSQNGIVQWVQAFWGCLTSDDVEGPESCPRLHVLISSTTFSAPVIAELPYTCCHLRNSTVRSRIRCNYFSMLCVYSSRVDAIHICSAQNTQMQFPTQCKC